VDRADGAREADLAGTYRANGGDLITVARYDFGDNVDRLALMSTREGYWGTLFPEGADRYVFAPARSGRFPPQVRVEFRLAPNGFGREIAMTVPDVNRVAATRVDAYEARPISFANGDVTLAAEVVHPRTGGPHPGVVLVHSSGNQSRNGPVGYFRLIANLLDAHGIAALVYD